MMIAVMLALGARFYRTHREDRSPVKVAWLSDMASRVVRRDAKKPSATKAIAPSGRPAVPKLGHRPKKLIHRDGLRSTAGD